MNERPTWDETFFDTTKVWAKRSSCKYYKVAVAFVRGKQLLQIGYNGPPKELMNVVMLGVEKK